MQLILCQSLDLIPHQTGYLNAPLILLKLEVGKRLTLIKSSGCMPIQCIKQLAQSIEYKKKCMRLQCYIESSDQKSDSGVAWPRYELNEQKTTK